MVAISAEYMLPDGGLRIQVCCVFAAKLGGMLIQQAAAWSLLAQAGDCTVPSAAYWQVQQGVLHILKAKADGWLVSFQHRQCSAGSRAAVVDAGTAVVLPGAAVVLAGVVVGAGVDPGAAVVMGTAVVVVAGGWVVGAGVSGGGVVGAGVSGGGVVGAGVTGGVLGGA